MAIGTVRNVAAENETLSPGLTPPPKSAAETASSTERPGEVEDLVTQADDPSSGEQLLLNPSSDNPENTKKNREE